MIENKSNNFEDMRNKQIEEMEKDLLSAYAINKLYSKDVAEYLYNAGYRKSSEVAEEIFGEIERAFFKHYDEQVTYSPPTLPYHTRNALGFSLNVLFMEIQELKKKYTEGGG